MDLKKVNKGKIPITPKPRKKSIVNLKKNQAISLISIIETIMKSKNSDRLKLEKIQSWLELKFKL